MSCICGVTVQRRTLRFWHRIDMFPYKCFHNNMKSMRGSCRVFSISNFEDLGEDTTRPRRFSVAFFMRTDAQLCLSLFPPGHKASINYRFCVGSLATLAFDSRVPFPLVSSFSTPFPVSFSILVMSTRLSAVHYAFRCTTFTIAVVLVFPEGRGIATR
jgi:hypothetical protein